MKLITRELRAGLMPERLIADGKLSVSGKILFPILTLYAVPDETGEEWEFDVGQCNEKYLPIGRDKIGQVLKELEEQRFIADLTLTNPWQAVFSFPEWVMKMLQVPDSFIESPLMVYNKQKENPPAPPFVKGGDEEESKAVHKVAPPEQYAEKLDKTGQYKCSECKKLIKKGEIYFYKGGRAKKRLHPECAGGKGMPGVGAGEKIPFAEVATAGEGELLGKAKWDKPIGYDMPEDVVKAKWPIKREKTIIGMVGADLSLEIIRALHDREHVKGDAFQVIDLTRGIIEGYLEAMPEL